MAGGDGVDAMYMDNLDEFINDENKVVTYRWLSTTLQVHVNQAKQMLYNFVIQQRNKNDENDLNVTYFLAGLQKDENSTKIHRCEVVSEDKLDAIKSTFQKLYSCHVYSVQKSKLQDSNALYITDYNLMKENIFDSCSQSAIKFNATKRVVESKPVVQEIKREDVKPSFLDNDTKANTSKPEIKEKTEKTTAPKKNNTTGIAGMFAKANVKKESKSSEQTQNSSKTETKETEKKNSAVQKKSPGVMSFFANSTAKSKPSEEKPKPSEEKPKEIRKEVTISSNKNKDEKIDKRKNGQKKKPASSDSDDEFVTQKKKRRRIKNNLFDSSSEEEMEAEEPLPSPPPAVEESKDEEAKDEEEEEEMEDDEAPIPDTPEQKPKIEKAKKEEPPSVSVNSDGRRRKHIKRKKKKTYVNDEGFMVTETVMESDSTDASDIEPSTNKPAEAKKPGPAAVAAKAHADKGKQKQSSLMSFFTKK